MRQHCAIVKRRELNTRENRDILLTILRRPNRNRTTTILVLYNDIDYIKIIIILFNLI